VPVLYDPARPADVAIDTQDLRDTKWAGIYLEGLATPEPTPGPGGWVQTGNVIASASARKRIQGKKLEHCAELRDRGKLTQAQFAEIEARLRSDQPGIT
jgi:hypothetical protein